VTSPTFLLLGAIGVSLVLLPPMLVLLDRVGRHTPDIAITLATQQLARRPASYSRLFLVLTLTLALGCFAALFNGTLATSYADRAAYLSGADLRLVEGQANATDLERQAAPLADHLSLLPGAIDGMSALRDTIAFPAGASQGDVTTLAVDPARLPRLVSWRADFAEVSLSTLLQRLQTTPTPQETLPAIVNDQVLQTTHEQIGSHFGLLLDGKISVDFVIVGTFHYFPTLEPGQMALVCDLARLLQELNRNPLLHVAPNEVWLKLAPSAPRYTAEAVMDRLANNPQHHPVQVEVQQVYDRMALAARLRNDPLHFSTAGALLLDLLVAAVLSVIGFVALFVLIVQRRAFELGVLRVLGLSWRQAGRSLAWEQVVMLCWAVAVGIGAGVALAQLALPPLSTDVMGQQLIPPFAIQVDVSTVLQMALFLAVYTAATLTEPKLIPSVHRRI
jgi:putative ABC transport system permease protein